MPPPTDAPRPAAAAAPEIRIVRDVRLDQIGFCDELVGQYADRLRPKVKVDLLEKGVDRAAGDFFDGLLVQYETSSIDAGKFYRLFKSGRFGVTQFLACLTVNKKAAAELLSGIEVEAISTKAGFATQSLRVSRRKNVSIRLVDAVKSLAESVPRD